MVRWAAIAGALAGMTLLGCQSQSATEESTESQTAAEHPSSAVALSTDALVVRPDWVSNPGIGGVLGAVGVAARNELGTRFQVEEARFAARLEIARMLETRVQSVGRDDTNQHIEASRDNAKVARGGASTHDKEGIDRRLTDAVLAGTRQRGLWVEPHSGDVFVWMVVDGRVHDAVTHSVENGVSVFIAAQRIEDEYVPPRPEIIVEIEGAPASPQQAPSPKTSLEQLEEFLNELRSQPIGEGDGTSSDATRTIDPDLTEEVTGGGG